MNRGKKLNKTSMIVIICTGSICLFAAFCAISGCIVVIVYRKYRFKKLLNVDETDTDCSYDNEDESVSEKSNQVSSGSVEDSGSENEDFLDCEHGDVDDKETDSVGESFDRRSGEEDSIDEEGSTNEAENSEEYSGSEEDEVKSEDMAVLSKGDDAEKRRGRIDNNHDLNNGKSESQGREQTDKKEMFLKERNGATSNASYNQNPLDKCSGNKENALLEKELKNEEKENVTGTNRVTKNSSKKYFESSVYGKRASSERGIGEIIPLQKEVHNCRIKIEVTEHSNPYDISDGLGTTNKKKSLSQINPASQVNLVSIPSNSRTRCESQCKISKKDNDFDVDKLEAENQQKSTTSLSVFNTQTVNGSFVGLSTEEMRSAQIVKKQNASSSGRSSDSDQEKNEAKKTTLGHEDIVKLAKVSIQAHKRKKRDGKSQEQTEKHLSNVTERKHGSKGGSGHKLPGHSTLFIMSMLCCFSVAVASHPDLNLLQTVTADIEIEIPDDLFESVHVLVNKMHANPIDITGDKPFFTLKVFEIDSVSAIVDDKCRGKDPRLCDTGTCDPPTGKCVCPKKFNYVDLFQKCVPDCSISCPFETYVANPCTITSPAVCEKCRDPCPPGQFESTPCGGKKDRKCSDISRLPAVKTGNEMISENRMNAQGMNKRVYPKPQERPVIAVNRGTGIEVVVNILEAEFAVKIGEVIHKDHDKDPGHHRFPLCKHDVPLYYIAKRAEGKDKFYHPHEKHGRCSNKKFGLENDAIYCLSLDHDLVRLFTKTKPEISSIRHSEGSVTCKRLIQQCLNCNINCSRQSQTPHCSKQPVGCYNSCKAVNCDCLKEHCPCQSYVTKRCDSKVTNCVGTTISKITLAPVFSSKYLFCHARVLQLATYKIRTDLYVKNKLVTSRLHYTLANPRASAVVDDYGYMTITMPDSLQIDGKNLLLRRVKNTMSVEIGHFETPSINYNGPSTDALALMPLKPFLINNAMWKKATCDSINIQTFRAIDKYPLRNQPPEIFKKIYDLTIKQEEINNDKNNSAIFMISKSDMHRFMDLNMPKHKSVLRSIFPNSVIDPGRLSCRLIKRTSYWSILVEGYLNSCPGSLTAKLYDQDRANELMFHYDFAVTNARQCHFNFEFSIPMTSKDSRDDKAYVLHLITSKQTMKLVLVRERKVDRILPSIVIPEVNKGKFLNAVVPISVVAGGLVFLLILLVIFGAVTKPRLTDVVRDSDFHYRHVFVIVWFVGARLAKSILLTITFISYILVVIHSKNYHTLKTFDDFQKREKLVFASVFEEMEKHRIAEIDRQNRRFIEEKNICEIKLQKLDVYLSKRKREASWQQQFSRRFKSIRLSALSRFQENWDRARTQFEWRKNQIEGTINQHMNQIKSQVDHVKGKVLGHGLVQIAMGAFKMYRFFGGSKSFAQYVNLDVQLNQGVNYQHRLQSFQYEFQRFTRNLKSVRESQEKSESLNFQVWEEATKKRDPLPVPKLHSIKYRKDKVNVKFDKNLIQDVLGIAWVIDMVKSKVFSKVGLILMITIDALFFVYRHTRTYAMAVLMVHGFKKIYDLDRIEKKRQKEEEMWYIRTNGLYQGYSPVAFEDSSHTSEETSGDKSDKNSVEGSDENSEEENDESSEQLSNEDSDEDSDSSNSMCQNSVGDSYEDSDENYEDNDDARDSSEDSSGVLMERGLVGEGLSTSTDEFERRGGVRSLHKIRSDVEKALQHDTSSTSSTNVSDSNATKTHELHSVGTEGCQEHMDENESVPLREEENLVHATLTAKDSEKSGCVDPNREAAECEVIGCEATTSDAADREAIDSEAAECKAVDCEAVDCEAVECETVECETVECEAAGRGCVNCEVLPNNNYAADKNDVLTSDNTLDTQLSDDQRQFEEEDEEESSSSTYSEYYADYSCKSENSDEPSMADEIHDVFVTVIGWIGGLLLWFVTKMKKIRLINMVLLNTHQILIFILACFVLAGTYFTLITAKYVLRTPVLDELGFFEAKITPIVTYRKVVNTRTAVNAFMINHVHIPYYEARMNARIEVYRLKAAVLKKLQCARAVLYNTEFCSWKKAGEFCNGLDSYDDGFYNNLTQFKCHMNPALPRRYSNFDKVQFRNEMIRSYDPYIEAFRGLILDTFEMILAIIGIQIAIKMSSKLIFSVLFSFDMIRQIKVYQTKRPLETWETK